MGTKGVLTSMRKSSTLVLKFEPGLRSQEFVQYFKIGFK